MNIRTVIFSIAFVVALLFAARLVTARTEVVSDPLSEPADVLAAPEQSSNQVQALIPSHRPPLDECFDVPLSERASCRLMSQVPTPSYRKPLDECYDVSLKEVVSCRNTSQASSP